MSQDQKLSHYELQLTILLVDLFFDGNVVSLIIEGIKFGELGETG